MQVFGGVEVDDRIPDDLAGSVVSDVASPVGEFDFDSIVREQLTGPLEVLFGVFVASDGEDRLVLREDQCVANGPIHPHRHPLELPCESIGVAGAAPVLRVEGVGVV